MTTHAILYALLSAVLFGISTPAAKAFLGSTNPTVLAGLFYCGAGVGVALMRRFAFFRLTEQKVVALGVTG
jgi:drug/metabolite transporter (DMT)-like permease